MRAALLGWERSRDATTSDVIASAVAAEELGTVAEGRAGVVPTGRPDHSAPPLLRSSAALIMMSYDVGGGRVGRVDAVGRIGSGERGDCACAGHSD